jgi:hypothetical protein
LIRLIASQFLNCFTHDFAIDWISEELFAAGNDRAAKEQGRRGLVEQLEGPIVDADLVHLQEHLRRRRRGAEDFRHLDPDQTNNPEV